jgi:hypothetical protein
MPNAAAENAEASAADAALSGERNALSTAIAALTEEQRRLDALEDARTRAREQSWAAASNEREAETALRKVRADERSRLAYAFAEGNVESVSPVTIAQSGLAAAQAEIARITEVEEALDTELITVSNRRDRAQTAVHAALAALVCNSPEFHHLLAEQTKAWARLRGIRKACALIAHELHAQMPDEFDKRWQAVVSLDPQAVRDATGQPIPTDEAPRRSVARRPGSAAERS